MKIGILRETKTPPDKRVPLTPMQCKQLMQQYPELEILVQPDGYRAFTNDEYKAAGISLKQDLSDCDILMGVKEVKKDTLLTGKTYFIFSHTAKKQSYNRELLRSVLEKKIRLVDYEYLTNEDNTRVVAFGRWAGIVGAYNGLRGWGLRHQKYNLKPAWQCRDRKELFSELSKVKLNRIKILITGGGRVAQGAMEIFSAIGIRKTEPEDYLSKDFNETVYCQLNPWNYVKRLDRQEFELHHFFHFPEEYETTFLPYTKKTDLLVACHFWDPRSPVFMTIEDMRKEDFNIKLIADVSCDINGPIPSTIRPSAISDPFYGFSPENETEGPAFTPENITVMAVDNLPGELPRDASEDFGYKLMTEVFPFLLGEKEGEIVERATIAENGSLTPSFAYLEDYVKGIE